MDDIPEETKKENTEESKHFFSDFDLWRYGYVEVGKKTVDPVGAKNNMRMKYYDVTEKTIQKK